jgi:hypothetical protein
MHVKLNRIQAAGILTLFMLFTVPSIAFSGDAGPSCYYAELLYDDIAYGRVRLMVSNSGNILEVEIEEFPHTGEYTVEIFKDLYTNILVVGTIEIDAEGNGKAIFEIPYHSPDLIVYVRKGEIELTSSEWVECEKPAKPIGVKVSPSSLNLKSNGRWVNVKITISIDDTEPSEFKMKINNGVLDPYSVKVSRSHIILKFSRAELQEICEEGEEVILSFKVGDQTIELSDTIKVINPGKNVGATSAQGNSNKSKNKNGHGKGKNKNH